MRGPSIPSRRAKLPEAKQDCSDHFGLPSSIDHCNND